MVTALPGEITRIKMHFDKAGRYVWHCHILSHEDHEMMRVVDEPKKPRHKRHKRHHEHAKTRPGKWKPRNRRNKRHGKRRDD